MSKSLSVDLRIRVVAAIEGGMSCRQAAWRYGVSPSSAIRWNALKRQRGDVKPGALGGDRRSGRIESHAQVLLDLVARQPDITLAELKAALAAQGVQVGASSIWRFFERRRITLKKSRRTRTSRAVPTS